jgi:alpha-1,3-rhamnosyl/mannosyltransferase
VPPARIAVTPAAPDPCFTPAPARQVDALRARLKLPERYVLYVGTNRPHKNLPRLVEAWARIADGRTDGCHLVLAGPEDDRYPEARRRARAMNLKTVVFPGAIPEADLPALYSGARLAVQPSLCEGFGLPVLEAMACGTPVACARIPALVEIGGDAALYFDPEHTGEMADALGRGLDEQGLRAELVSRGRAQAGGFSWAQTAVQTLAAYRELEAGATGAGRPS